MGKFISIFKDAIKNIISNRLRSSLTALGLIIGITSVILLVGIGEGATTNVKSNVQSLGTGTLTVSITSDDNSLEYSQAEDILNLSNVECIAPYKTISATVSKATTTSNRARVLATTPDYLTVMNLGINAGRKLSDIDLNNTNKVCLIGSSLASSLFENTKNKDIVGQTINLNGDKYLVAGVLAKVGSTMGTNIDNMIIIPFTTAKYLKGDTSVSTMYVKVKDENLIDRTTSTIGSYLEKTLNISSDDYTVSSQDSMRETAETIKNTLSLLLGGIAGISLVVGGIGVMNVMLVSVTERTKEIGIRKALGARRKDILVQFLIEALILCMLGGIIGISLGMIIGTILQIFGFSYVTSTSIITIAFGCSLFIGIVFGIFPAYKASKLNPIDALRSE